MADKHTSRERAGGRAWHHRQQHRPCAVETPMDTPLEEHPDHMEKLLSEIPLGRMGKPEEMASLAMYFVSGASTYVTRSTFFMDGCTTRQAGSL